MEQKRIHIYDTTLRDGSQTEGISYSLRDKIVIAEKLDEFGLDFIEGGWPFSNPKDREFFAHFKAARLKNSQLVPFGSTAHASGLPAKDKNLAALVAAGTEYVTIFGKTWDLHARDVLRISLDDNLGLISGSVEYLVKRGRKVFYDAEHFFDGYKANPEYAIKTIAAAIDAGAHLAVFCDTNGGTLPAEAAAIVACVKSRLGLKEFGVHCHNDTGLALAVSLDLVELGASQIQGTINGYGERCGNTDLTAVMAVLSLKMGLQLSSKIKIEELTRLSNFVSEVSNMNIQDNHPFVGRSAFAHKAGVHIDAVLKNPKAYEQTEPAKVGNRRRFLVSELSGKSALAAKAGEMALALDKKSPGAIKLHRTLQEMENKGYQFEAAEASFKLLLRKTLKRYKKFFDLESFRVSVERREDSRLISEATIKLKVQGKVEHTASTGDGPVNALDSALRKALLKYFPSLSRMRLSDFKVRVLDATCGTAAKVRVLIESQDEDEAWTTIGVSENIIEASWEALADSIEYKLLKDSKT